MAPRQGHSANGGNEIIDTVYFIPSGADRPEPKTLTVGPDVYNLALTPDGSLALVVSDGLVKVINIAARTVEPIQTNGVVSIGSLTVAPDGLHAFVVLTGTRELCVIDTTARSCTPIATVPGDF